MKRTRITYRRFSKYTLSFILALGLGLPFAFSQNSMNADGSLHTATPSSSYSNFIIPNSTDKPYLYLSLLGADGGKRQYTSIGTCTKEGGQGAHAGAWFKIGNDGLVPGGTLRFFFGKKGADAGGVGIEGAGGGGGTAIAYLPPGVDSTNPNSWKLLLVAGGGGGAASSGVCAGSSGMPGQEGPNGTDGTGSSKGTAGSGGKGGTDGWLGSGGGGYLHSGRGTCNCDGNYKNHKCYNIDGSYNLEYYGGGLSGTAKVTTANDQFLNTYWSGGLGGGGPMVYNCDGNENAGGYGFGGGGTGRGSGGGGGGYSGGGGGGLVGITGGGGGGGGGSYANASYAMPSVTVLQQRGTTSSPADGAIQYQFSATNPVATRDLGFEAHKGTEVQVLKAGSWTLLWQYDGNLVLYQSGVGAKWASNTNNKGTDIYFQGDGNLVIRQNGAAVWASNTANDEKGGKGGRKLVLTSEGGLFIIDQDGKVIWQGH